MAMQTRSVRVDADALRLADATFAAQGTSFSEFVRRLVNSIARTGRLPVVEEDEPARLDEDILAFEAFAENLTMGVGIDGSYSNTPAKELLSDVLAERYA